MVVIRSANEIIVSLIDFFRLAQPDLTTVPGAVARDLFIEGPAAQLSLLYDELSSISDKQSLNLSIGTDLDKLAKNFGLVRKQSTPSTGVALLTFSSLNAVINVNQGATITSINGMPFSVATGLSIIPSNSNFYRSIATQFQAQLAFAGITDQFAAQVTVTAGAPGTAGNIGQYTLNATTIAGVNNVTNVNSFLGGTDQETDATFRNRILSTFSGSSVGTSLGYLNAALSVNGVQDATVIGPGNPLMTRDGTITITNPDGTISIESEGIGGKVDVVVLGTNEQQNTDTFIYQDKSNTNDPTNPKNNVVLGQIAGQSNLTISQKRVTDIQNAELPSQPVDTILQVTGSLSGANFISQSIDGYGRSTGNFKLIKDTGAYAGSPFGFDTFAWTSNQIIFQEDLIKGQNNGQDPTTFSGVLQITNAQQNLSITNENSLVTTNRSIIQLLHTPVTNITRVFNTNTGERYIISNQNVDNTPQFNLTGLIQISGNTLPSPSDILQVDYSWIVNYDRYSDFDGLVDTNNPRTATDSIDWGYASAIRKEIVEFDLNSSSNFYVGNTSHPIDTVIATSTFTQVDGYIQTISIGSLTNRLEIVLDNLAIPTTSIDSVKWKNSNVEIYNTPQNNGSFSNQTTVVGIQVLFNTTIVLPTDSVGVSGDRVEVIINSNNVFQTSTTSQGSSNGSQITLPTSFFSTIPNSLNLEVSYIASVSDLFSSAVNSLPASRIGNGYSLSNNNGFNNFSPVNISRRENATVQQNLSNQFFIELNLPATDYTLLVENIISVIRLSDNEQLWNIDHQGSIITGTDGNYQLIFSGYNNPAINDKILVIYYSLDNRRFQPFSFNNQLIKNYVNTIGFNSIDKEFTIPLINFTSQNSGLHFQVLEENSSQVLFNIIDGYLIPTSNNQALIGSLSVNFATLPDLLNKQVRIIAPTTDNNLGFYEIFKYDPVLNEITIGLTLEHINKNQISVIRVLDGQEIWNYNGQIDLINNQLTISSTSKVNVGDAVFVLLFNFNNLREAPTRVIGTTVDQNTNIGVMTVNGTTIFLAQDVIFTATNTGLNLDLLQALQSELGLTSTGIIPSNIKVAKLVNLAKVNTFTLGSNIVLDTIVNYDVLNTTIANNLYYADTMIGDPSLTSTEFILPNTSNNILNTSTSPNLPTLGDQLQATFYYTVENDSENLSYTRLGSLYTNKKFALINKIFVSSGFGSSQSTKFTGSSFTKPSLGSRYTAFYNYLAPKENERILVQYNFNQLISDVTFTLENVRPINADVLAKVAQLVELDLTMNVVINPTFINSTATVLQNLRDQMVSALTSTALGQTIDQITLINIAQGVQGISRARILYFNKTGQPGQILTFTAQQNQFFESNNIILNTEVR